MPAESGDVQPAPATNHLQVWYISESMIALSVGMVQGVSDSQYIGIGTKL